MSKSRISSFRGVATGMLLAAAVSGLTVLLSGTASADSVRITDETGSVRITDETGSVRITDETGSVRITSASDDTQREHIMGNPH